MALSVWFNGSCSCQSLTGGGVTVMQRNAVCLTAFFTQIHTLDFGTYRASLFLYMIKFVYQIYVKSLSVIKLQ